MMPLFRFFAQSPSHLPVIGRYVSISFPEWGGAVFEAKVDTGAYLSAIHAGEITEDSEQRLLRFTIHTPHVADEKAQAIPCESRDYQTVRVRNTSGIWETRYRVVTSVKMGDKTYQADFTLADRAQMRRTVILGAKLLKGNFLIDLSHET